MLQHLRLSGCIGVTDVGISKVAKGCSKLQELHLDGCVEVTDAVYGMFSLCRVFK